MYLGAIVGANLLTVAIGPWVSVVNAFLFIGLDLTSRDYLHDAWQGRGLWLKMLALIVSGSLLSYLINQSSGRIAVASCLAFVASGVVDAIVYQVFFNKPRAVRINVSNVLSAIVDSTIFPAIAFGIPLMWAIVLGQFVAKAAGGYTWSLLLRARSR